MDKKSPSMPWVTLRSYKCQLQIKSAFALALNLNSRPHSKSIIE